MDAYAIQLAPKIELQAVGIQYLPPIDTSLFESPGQAPSLIIPLNVKNVYANVPVDLDTRANEVRVNQTAVTAALGYSYWNTTMAPVALTYSLDTTTASQALVYPLTSPSSFGANVLAIASAVLRQMSQASSAGHIFQDYASLEVVVNSQVSRALSEILGTYDVLRKLVSISDVFPTMDGLVDVSDLQSCYVMFKVSVSITYSVFGNLHTLTVEGLDASASLAWS